LRPVIIDYKLRGGPFLHIFLHALDYEFLVVKRDLSFAHENVFNLAIHYLFELKAVNFLTIRQFSINQFVGHYSKCPHITFEGKAVALQTFRRHIIGRPSIIGKLVNTINNLHRKTEICKFDFPIFD